MFTYMHYMHDVSTQIKQNKLELAFPFRCVYILYLLHCTERYVYNCGRPENRSTFYVKLTESFFSENKTKIVKSSVFASLFATIAVGGEKHGSIHLWYDFTGPVYSQFQYI